VIATCQKSWGSLAAGWTFCTREKGHAGACINSVRGAMKPDELLFEQQPEALAANARQREEERKQRAKKASGGTAGE